MKWLRDPIWVFIVLGLIVFYIDARQSSGDLEIEVTAADVQRLTAQWQAQTGRDPSDKELNGLIDQFIEEEVYYREALNYQLQTNDTIIRRRLVQKLTFLTEDVATSVEPDRALLLSYYEDNKAAYKQPVKYSFQHVYFSRDRRKDAEADARAERARIAVTQDGVEGEIAHPKGDPFMLQSNFAERSAREIASTFGVRFAEALPELTVNDWSTPVPSAYGHHLVYLHSVSDSFTPDFDAVAKRVATDYESHVRKQANTAFKENLLKKYTVVRP